VLGSREMPDIVEDMARAIGAPLKRLGTEYTCAREEGGTWHFRGRRWNLPHLPAPALMGDTQYANAATAIAALEEIDARSSIPAAAVAQGLERVQLTARFQVIAPATPAAPTWILDVAHNPAAARVLACNLRDHPSGGRTLAVCGILADKDALGIVAELSDRIDAWWCVTTDGDRGRSGASLAQTVQRQVAAPVEAADSTSAGCAAALVYAKPQDRIVVFGSFHVVGPALDWLEARDLLPPATVPEYTATPRDTHVQG
jgi:dihydrofolate synthase/folylpolyglutamate synthase